MQQEVVLAMAVERGLDGGEGMAARGGKYGPSTSSGLHEQLDLGAPCDH